MSDLILFEHEDGRYGVAPEGLADFTNGEPKWHRVGPVEVVRLAQAEAKPAVRLPAQVQPAAPDCGEYGHAEGVCGNASCCPSAQVQPAEQVGEPDCWTTEEDMRKIERGYGGTITKGPRIHAEGEVALYRRAASVSAAEELLTEIRTALNGSGVWHLGLNTVDCIKSLIAHRKHQPVSAEALLAAKEEFEFLRSQKAEIRDKERWTSILNRIDAALTPPAHPAEPGKGGAE